MFVITGGMQKSGSTLLHVYAKGLIGWRYGLEGQSAFLRWVEEGPVGGRGDFPWDGWMDRLDDLEQIAGTIGPFVLKTHSALDAIRRRTDGHDVVFAYSYRDPRDVVLSAMDHYARSQASRGGWLYDACPDVPHTLPFVRECCANAMVWLDAPDVLAFRYEDLVTEPERQARRLAERFGIADAEAAAAAVVEEERSRRVVGRNQLNKGVVRRWPAEMSEADLASCDEALGEYIRAMGYPLASECPRS